MTTDQALFRPYHPRRPWTARTATVEALVLDPPAQIGAAFTGAPGRSDADDYTIGLEEEMFLVDRDTLDCVQRMPEAFLEEARQVLGNSVHREIISSMVEIVTGTHTSVAAAGSELRYLRQGLAAVAERHGLAVLACGTHPFADWRSQTLSQKPRYQAVASSLGTLSKRVHVCGFHVHVALPDPSLRIPVMNRAVGFLPILLALSTSSPFWMGEATGLKSYRSAAYDESPRTGLPIRFADAGEFDRFIHKMEQAGFIPDQSFLWWAIRPSLKYPTLELRIADSCTSSGDAIAIAALYRCLIHALVQDPTLGAAWEEHHHLVNNENRWQAIRYGLGGQILDAAAGSTQSMAAEVRQLVDRLRPSAEALGCEHELDGIDRILDHGTSADRQAGTYQMALARGHSCNEAVHAVVADIAERTLAA